MREEFFYVYGRFPGLNDIIATAKKHPNAYSNMKRECTHRVIACAQVAGIKPFDGAIKVSIVAIEPDRRRDPCNIQAGCFKFIMDGLVDAGIIKNDNQKYVKGLSFGVHPETDKENPKVAVRIREA